MALRGQVQNLGRSGNGYGGNTVAFSGAVSGGDVTLVTRPPSIGNPVYGAEWRGRLNGNTVSGRWDHGTTDSGEFNLTREEAAR